MNLGESIYEHRTEKNLSQGELAGALEVSRQSVSKWENNMAVPELDKLVKMAAIFQISLDELVTGAEREITTSTSSPEGPASRVAEKEPDPEHFSARKIIGIIALCCGLVAAIVCIILAITLDNRYEEDLMAAAAILGLPLVTVGICCLLAGKHALLIGAWLFYFSVWFVFFVLNTHEGLELDTAFGVFTLVILILGAALSVGTLVQLWRGKLGLMLLWKILLSLLIGVFMLVTVMLLQPPRSMGAQQLPYPEVYIEPISSSVVPD